jgi:hypothetical protein
MLTAQLPIKLLLLTAGALLAVYLTRARGTARASAAVKLLFLGFVAFGAWAVLRPDDVSALARLLGVGAGMNLLLYALVIAFAFTTVSNYLRFKELEGRYVSLARVIALQGAIGPRARRSAPDEAEEAGRIAWSSAPRADESPSAAAETEKRGSTTI